MPPRTGVFNPFPVRVCQDHAVGRPDDGDGGIECVGTQMFVPSNTGRSGPDADRDRLEDPAGGVELEQGVRSDVRQPDVAAVMERCRRER